MIASDSDGVDVSQRPSGERVRVSMDPMLVSGPVVNERSLKSATEQYLEIRFGGNKHDQLFVLDQMRETIEEMGKKLGLDLNKEQVALAVQFGIAHHLYDEPTESRDEMANALRAVGNNRRRMAGGGKDDAKLIAVTCMAEAMYGGRVRVRGNGLPTPFRGVGGNERPNPLTEKVKNLLNESPELKSKLEIAATKLTEGTRATVLRDVSHRW